MKGTIKKYTAKNGAVSWRLTYDLPPDPVTGKRRQKRATAPTRKAAEELLTEALHQLQTGAYVEQSRALVRDYLPRWLEAAAPTVRPTTVATYRALITGHITPTLGAVPLAKLTVLQVQTFYAATLAAGLSPTTVGMIHAVLHRALAQAVKWRLLARNPCDGVEVPRADGPAMQVWAAAQARTFLTATAAHELAALWRLALTTGLRQGELLALTWADTDLERGTLAVRRTLTRDQNGRVIVGEPKTAAGRRSVALPPFCVAALRQHKARQNERRLQWGDAWQDGGLVFDRGDGAALTTSSVRRTFWRLVTCLNVPVLRFHDLRHTAATLMLAQGVHPKIVQERLGHSTVSMTLDRYSHVSMDMQREAANRLDEALGA